MSADTFLKCGRSFSDQQVQQQLQKIFQSPAFSSSDILRHFLGYITEETLAGRSNTIKEYTIAVNVLHKPVSFKPQHDAIVRIHAGRLRRALNYYYKIEGQSDEVEISVPKGSYVPVFGSRNFSETEKDMAKHSETGSRNDGIKLVIRPFKTFEKEKSKLAFTDNLGQQLSAELGRFSDFSVVSYYRTQQPGLKNNETQLVSGDFGARFIITGNVLFENRLLRVAVQLTDTQSGTQIWTERFHQKIGSSGLFAAADQIVDSVIAVLGDFNGVILQHLSRSMTKNQTDGASVLSWYYDFYTMFNEDSFRETTSAMEDIVARHPSNEMAWSLLGKLSLLSFLFTRNTGENPMIRGLRCARMALKINPLCQEAHISLALANILLNNRQAGIDGLEYALALNPNASGNMGVIGCLMIGAGEYERGFELVCQSMERNKAYPMFFHLFTSIYFFRKKDFYKSFLEGEKMDGPDLVLSNLLRISTLSQLGKKAEADSLKKALKGNPLNKPWITKDYLQDIFNEEDLFVQLSKGFRAGKIPVLTVA